MTVWDLRCDINMLHFSFQSGPERANIIVDMSTKHSDLLTRVDTVLFFCLFFFPRLCAKICLLQMRLIKSALFWNQQDLMQNNWLIRRCQASCSNASQLPRKQKWGGFFSRSCWTFVVYSPTRGNLQMEMGCSSWIFLCFFDCCYCFWIKWSWISGYCS